MGDGMRTIDVKVVVKEVTKNKQHVGWKVYIGGEKFPKKPVDFYSGCTANEAQEKAIKDWKEKYKEFLVHTPMEPAG